MMFQILKLWIQQKHKNWNNVTTKIIFPWNKKIEIIVNEVLLYVLTEAYLERSQTSTVELFYENS